HGRPRFRRRAGRLRTLSHGRRGRPADGGRLRRRLPARPQAGARAREAEGDERSRRLRRVAGRARRQVRRRGEAAKPRGGRTMIRAATDVGGTFTDLVYFRTAPETGEQDVVTAKSDTTPPDFEQGVLEVIAKSGVSAEEIAFLAHGTTVVINALAERKGVVTGLITTEGFRDVLEIARGNRPDFFNLHYEKPPPFVPRYLRREVRGRLAQDGSER